MTLKTVFVIVAIGFGIYLLAPYVLLAGLVAGG